MIKVRQPHFLHICTAAQGGAYRKKAQKSPEKPKARKDPKPQKPQSSKARVLTSKPDPKAQEPSPARPNTTSNRLVGTKLSKHLSSV